MVTGSVSDRGASRSKMGAGRSQAVSASFVLVWAVAFSLVSALCWSSGAGASGGEGEVLGTGDGRIWVIASVNRSVVRNGEKLAISALVKSVEPVERVEAELGGLGRVALEVRPLSGSGALRLGGYAGVYGAEWEASGVEAKEYEVTLRVRNASGHEYADRSLRFVGEASGASGGGHRSGESVASGGQARVDGAESAARAQEAVGSVPGSTAKESSASESSLAGKQEGESPVAATDPSAEKVVKAGGAPGSGDLLAQGGIEPLAPANDNFADREVLSGLSGSVTGSNRGATMESGEPTYHGNASAWYEWTAPGSIILSRQLEGACTFSLSPESQIVPSSGGSGYTVSVSASSSDCVWTATSDAPWLTITSGSSGTGSGGNNVQCWCKLGWTAYGHNHGC